MPRALALVLLLTAIAPVVRAQTAEAQADPAPAPDYLPEAEPGTVAHAGTWSPAHPSPWSDPSYQGLLAAGYLLAIPSAFMTGGVGVLLPVGMHYYHNNPTGGVRALFGILGGISAGAVAGGLIDQPEGGFSITRGMLVGAASGFFVWGLIDVAFFAERERPDELSGLSLQLDLDPQAGVAGMRVAGAL